MSAVNSLCQSAEVHFYSLVSQLIRILPTRIQDIEDRIKKVPALSTLQNISLSSPGADVAMVFHLSFVFFSRYLSLVIVFYTLTCHNRYTCLPFRPSSFSKYGWAINSIIISVDSRLFQQPPTTLVWTRSFIGVLFLHTLLYLRTISNDQDKTPLYLFSQKANEELSYQVGGIVNNFLYHPSLFVPLITFHSNFSFLLRSCDFFFFISASLISWLLHSNSRRLSHLPLPLPLHPLPLHHPLLSSLHHSLYAFSLRPFEFDGIWFKTHKICLTSQIKLPPVSRALTLPPPHPTTSTLTSSPSQTSSLV